MVGAAALRVGAERHHHFDVGCTPLERRRQNTDDRIRAAIECDGLPEHRRAAAKAAMPEAVPKQDDGGSAGAVFFGSEVPTESGLCAEQRQKLRCDRQPADDFGAAIRRGGKARAAVTGQALEGRLLRTPVEEVGV